MIAVDTNLLVYAHRVDSEWYVRASERLRELAEGKARWAIPWPCLHEYLAIVTHPRIFATPTPLEAAIDQAAAWIESPSLILLTEADDSFAQLRELLIASRVTGPKVHDARIAALCLLHGVRTLWTADRDFGRFPALETCNPLATAE